MFKYQESTLLFSFYFTYQPIHNNNMVDLVCYINYVVAWDFDDFYILMCTVSEFSNR